MKTEVITVSPDTKIAELAKVLIDNKITAAPVVDEDGVLVGIVTEGDLLHKKTSPQAPVINTFLGGLAYTKEFEQYQSELQKLSACIASEIMTTKLTTISADTSIKEISTLMVNRNVKSIPVITDEKLVGIVTRADVLQTLA